LRVRTLLRVLTAGACLFFFTFAVARAALVPLTYDEAATYLRYIPGDILAVFNFDVATNHFLNTLLTKIAYLAGGNSEAVLRLPNLIGYAMYLWFSLLILRGLQDRVIAFAGFMLLNLNLYVLDFFSLTRGYGLSLSFLMGTIFFLLRFVTQLSRGAAVHRDLSRALLFACGAVMANFTLLNVYLAVFVVGLAAFVVFNATTARNPAPDVDDRRSTSGRRRRFPWLPLVATAFLLLVFSQDMRLSEHLYQPVEVRLAGLDDAELDAALVSRVDLSGRMTGLSYDASAATWRVEPRAHVAGLRIELPAAIAGKLSLIEVIVGNQSFRRDQGSDGGWQVRDAGATRVFDSDASLSMPRSRISRFRPVLNWTGDARYIASLAGYTALALSILGALAVALKGVGRLAIRANLLRDDQWRPLASSALWLTALAGAPLYLLRRESQLYYGGTQGLVQDTFYSIIGQSFYDRTYHAAQTQIVFGGILVTIAAFGVLLYSSYRRRQITLALPGICLLAIMVMTSSAIVAQRFLFETLFLLGRTALFYIPLYVLFAIFLCDLLAGLGRAARLMATSLLILALSFSTYHFVTAANLTHTQDWWQDAGTKAMMEDLGDVVAAERPTGSQVVLGVDWFYSAVAAFYASRHKEADITIVVVPTPSDFLYLEDRGQEGIDVIKRYPISDSVLARRAAVR
jgi:hypothetical protein